MAPAPKKEYSLEELESKHSDITVLYDFAEELVSTVESQFVADPEAQLEVVEPLISELGEATDILSEEFTYIAESRHKLPGRASKSRIEAALRKVYVAVGDYHKRVRVTGKKVTGAINNIADPIVQKIQRQIEKIVVVFLEFIQISLAALMGKAELEALKTRDPRIALMMHHATLAQQGQ